MAEVIRIIELQDMLLYFQEGFSGSSAIDDATLVASDTVMGVDTHALRDSRTTVPIGARFTTAGIATVRTVTDTQNSTQYTLDMTAPTAGTFDITVDGDTAAGLAYDITDTAFTAALEALSSVGTGNVSVVEATDVYTITFQGTLKNTVVTVTVDGSSLTAPNSHVLTQIQDGTTTWEVTFTPAIASGSVPADDDVITWYPRRLEFEPEGGEFEWGQTRERIIRKPRGIIKGSRRGVEQEMTVTTSFPFEFLRAQTTATDELDELTPYEVLEQEGFASDWMPSANGGVCEPYSIDLVIVDKPDCLSQQAQVWIFPQFDYTDLGPTVSEGIINLTGSCVAKKPITYRVTNDDDAINVLYTSGQTPG
jgi:hypothetical protein